MSSFSIPVNVSNKVASSYASSFNISSIKQLIFWCWFHYGSFLGQETQLRCDFHINFLSECFLKKTPQATNLSVIAIYLFSWLICIKKSHIFSFPVTRDYILIGQISNGFCTGNQAEGFIFFSWQFVRGEKFTLQ